MHAHDHDHQHADDHDHSVPDHGSQKILGRALLITLGFAGVEALAGWWAGSLALLGDAGHMVTDAGALGLAAIAAQIAKRPSSHQHTWGMGRAEVVAALINVVLMLGIVAGIVFSAFQRLRDPIPVQGVTVMIVAGAGLVLNIVILRTLSHGHADLNLRGAVLHVVGDLLGSVAAIAAGLIVWLTGWARIDPILSIVICVLIVMSSVKLLRDSVHVVMEGVPRHLDLKEIGAAMARTPGVASVHDLHIWQVHSDQIALTAHVVVWKIENWRAILGTLSASLAKDFGIEHVTLQPEPIDEVRVPLPQAKAR